MYDYTANVNHYNSKYNTTDGSVGLSYSYIVFTKRVSLAAYHRYYVKTRCGDDHYVAATEDRAETRGYVP